MASIGHPIVGDAKYGGPESVLDGWNQPQAALARAADQDRCPEGRVIDQTAELPTHFAESLATIGFEPMAGDMMPLDKPDPAKSPEAKQRRVAAAAKTRRKERRGERRSRGSQARRSAAVTRLAIFDCDGTLVDSGATIFTSR
jgi:23S rRNA pseudouridine955/2504/2580 synthase